MCYRAHFLVLILLLAFLPLALVAAPAKHSLSIKCPRSLHPDLCTLHGDLSALFQAKKLRLQFASSGASSTFQLDCNGNVSITSVVSIIAGGKVTESQGTYSFSLHDVEVEPGGAIKIKCKSGKCINTEGTNITPTAIDQTALIADDTQTLIAAFEALAKLQKFFVPEE